MDVALVRLGRRSRTLLEVRIPLEGLHGCYAVRLLQYNHRANTGNRAG